jgi:twinfilin-like protein
MMHTMAIPGLLVHAEDVGVHVDTKIEIHEPSELVFEKKDERKGKFRSLWNRDGFKGTEGVYAGMEGDKTFLDNLA